MKQNILNSLQFISQVLSQDIIPELEALESTNPSVDFTSTNAKLDNITSILNGIDFTPDTNVIAEFTVTSPMTSIDFSGLDINAHGGSYEIELRLVNATSTQSDINMYVNGDNVNSHYYSMSTYSSGGTTSSGNSNSAYTCSIGNSVLSDTALINLILANFYPVWHSKFMHGNTSGIYNRWNSVKKTTSVSNITQLTFTASVANSIGIGSKIIIRRKDK